MDSLEEILGTGKRGVFFMAHDVFISYFHEDKPVADAVCAALESEKIRCWIAPRDIPPGKNYPGEIMNAVKNCKVFVLVYSAHSNTSPDVLNEIEKAKNCRIPMIPFRITDVPLTPDMEYYIIRYQRLDALTAPLENHLPELTRAVQALLHINQSDLTDKNTIQELHMPPDSFVFIQGGSYLMGSPEDEAERNNYETQHQVKVGDFYMAKYPVTVAQFETFISEENYRTDADKKGGSFICDGKNYNQKSGVNWRCDTMGELQKDKQHPVIHVSWNDASAYCKWISEKLNRTFRLPTEAEWECACRAGTTTPFNTGNNLTTDQANYNGNYPYKKYPKGNYIGKTTPVGSYPPNGWGLYDMSGNVWEWCLDWYGKEYYNECKQQGIAFNPQGPETGSYRVLRGGYWYYGARYCRSAYRFDDSPGNRDGLVGFRLVFVP
jgi:formylglycine-generating enzyme required for sulfatase activity